MNAVPSRSDKPIVVVGSGGMLGRAFTALLESRRVAYDAVDRDALDLATGRGVDACITRDVRAVINCAAYTDVDGAESDPDAALAINGEGVGRLAARCAHVGATLTHFSTDYVFSGQAQQPYAVDTPRSPLGVYGQSKAAGELAIEKVGGAHLIVRTSWLYAPWGRNFVRTIADKSRELPRLRVVHDQHGRPTSATYLAERCLRLLETGANGVFHVTDGAECTWFEFATEIVTRLGRRCTVEPCTTQEYPRPARRPAYSVLDLSETELRLGPSRPWRDNLADVLRALRDNDETSGDQR